MSNSDDVPWYKQFWPWFIFSLPAIVVVAGLATWMIAIENKDSLVVDDYYKEGLSINRVLAEDKVAERLGLTATLDIDRQTGDILLQMGGRMDHWPEQLALSLIHPTSSRKDITLIATSISPNRYRAHLPQPINNRWYVKVNGSEPEAWQLDSEINLRDGEHWTF